MSLSDSIRRETTYLSAVGRTLMRLRTVTPDSTHTIVDIVERFASEKPDNIAFLYLDRVVTYRALDEGANRYAHWALDQELEAARPWCF